MPDPLLVDTDVLIDLLRGQPAAVGYLQGLTDPPLVSAVTVAELYGGFRDGAERVALTTSCPCWTRSRQMRLPIPPLPPVTTTFTVGPSVRSIPVPVAV